MPHIMTNLTESSTETPRCPPSRGATLCPGPGPRTRPARPAPWAECTGWLAGAPRPPLAQECPGQPRDRLPRPYQRLHLPRRLPATRGSTVRGCQLCTGPEASRTRGYMALEVRQTQGCTALGTSQIRVCMGRENSRNPGCMGLVVSLTWAEECTEPGPSWRVRSRHTPPGDSLLSHRRTSTQADRRWQSRATTGQ